MIGFVLVLLAIAKTWWDSHIALASGVVYLLVLNAASTPHAKLAPRSDGTAKPDWAIGLNGAHLLLRKSRANVQWRYQRRPGPLSLRVPHPRSHDVSDQQLARRHAARRHRGDERLRGDVGHPRRAGVGGALVDARAAEVGDQIGALMNAPPGSVATHSNVTTCQAVVASCFGFSGRRNKVVYTDMNFPSVMYFWEAQRSRGARVHMVPTDDGITVPTERLLDAIDEETLLVPISHVVFRSAYINDAPAIVEKAHAVGAHVVLDTFQSLGTVPVDVRRLNVDFACGGVLKWLCGGPGTAYFYVRPDTGRTLAPAFTGWFAHENPFGFEVGPTRYTASAYRFMNGTTPIPALEAARQA